MKKVILSTLLTTFLTPVWAASDLDKTKFSDHIKTPSPAVLATSPYGDVFVGVDKQGSLGKAPNKGLVKRLRDTNNDGVADEVTDFVKIDNPRGIVVIGNKVIVLHCNLKDNKPYNQDITVFTDADNDGVADGPGKLLVKGIGNPKFIQDRGADHCTNGLRLGVDGWLYISVGDFGFVEAEGTDGQKLTCYGGGVARVRPDGSELEMFIHGTRNVYDVAIDPFMNVFSRENTNDGVGWWIRFSHYIQSGEYGYPSLYKNFEEDMLPALGMYGGGSGTGALFLQEPGWPDAYNNKALMADWGRSTVFIHGITPDNASFTDKPQAFLKVSQVADLDVDASGRLYVAAWAGAGYKGNPAKGYVERYVPKGWKFKEFPQLSKASKEDLLNHINSDSFTARVYAQQEILARKDLSYVKGLLSLAQSGKSLESKAAAVYTLGQLAGEKSLPVLEKLSQQKDIREHTIRMMADRKSYNKKANVKLISQYLQDENPRVQVAAAVALGRIGDLNSAAALISVANPPPKNTLGVQKAEASGAKVQKSTKLTAGKGDSVAMKFDITGFRTLVLEVNKAGGKGGHHAAWVDPKVILTNGKVIDLTKLKWNKAKGGWGKTLINKDCQGKPLVDLKGKKLNGIGTHVKSVIEYKLPKGAKQFVATGSFSSGAHQGSSIQFAVSNTAPKTSSKDAKTVCSTPYSVSILPHVARQSLVNMKANAALINALNSSDAKLQSAALYAMKFMHDEQIVDALIARLSSADAKFKKQVYSVLMRLQQTDVDWDGSSWWKTRPDPTGPYYEPVGWSQSKKIAATLKSYLNTLSGEDKELAMAEMTKNRVLLDGPKKTVANKGPKKPGEMKMSETAIEDVLVYLSKHKGNASTGKKMIQNVGCIGCHNIEVGQPIKGPDLTKLGNMSKADLAEAIIRPGATIAKSWVNVTMKDGSSHLGTIVKKDAKLITLHNITGMATKLDAKKVSKVAPGLNMMSLHLVDSLNLQQFADLVEYIQSMDSKRKKRK